MAKLDPQVKINDTLYDIQAAEANKVKAPLTIKEITDDDSESTSIYNGSEARTISVVSAENGGFFKGPIKTAHIDNPDADHILNYGDVTAAVQLLTGSGWYSYISDVFAPITKNDANQYLGIVCGSNSLVSNFGAANMQNKYLPVYLYLSTDTGNLYYGTELSSTPIQIVNNANNLTGSGTTPTYTAESIKAALDALSARITTNTNNITSLTTTHTTDKNTLSSRITTEISNREDACEELSDRIDDLEDFQDKVTTISASGVKVYDSSRLNGQQASYYQKKIYVSTALPTSGIAEGDICIIYK